MTQVNISVDVPLALRFVPAAPPRAVENEEEIELSADECDEIEYEGDSFDLGEALAQTLGLAIDPYATGPGAEAARQAAGIVPDDAPRKDPEPPSDQIVIKGEIEP